MRTKQFLLGALILLAVATMAGCGKKDDNGGTTQKIYHETQGTAGDLTWKLTSDGTLTISGAGAMPNYEQKTVDYTTDSPWFRLDFASLVIESGVTTIGNWAFFNCDGMTSVTIPDSVETIGFNAFYHCDGLTGVTIPDSVTTIGSWAFYYCGHLTSVTIPDSVTVIGTQAFDGCGSLKDVIIMATTPPQLGYENFDSNSSDTLHVPAGCVATYKGAERWREAFANIVEQQ
jgi:hypothetical protein